MSGPTDVSHAPSPIRVLLAEDEAHLGMILQQYLTGRGFDVTVVRDGRAALEALRAESFDVALLDIVMPELDGLEVLRIVRHETLPPEIIVITGNGTSETAMTALKLGAYDFLSKPYRMAEVEAIVRRAWEKKMLLRDNHVMRTQVEGAVADHRVVTQFAPLMAVMTMVKQVAPSSSPVVVTGEVGTGKRLLARLLHEGGARPTGPFIEMACAQLSASQQANALFGVERGDSLATAERSIGRLELASGGTLYIDRIGALDLAVQATLMRALQDGSFVRVGGRQRVRVNTRLVASTTRDLARMAEGGTVRRDLLDYITAVQVGLPPLRDRIVDVAPLSEYFSAGFGGSSQVRVTPEAIAALEQYRWPGNVRELRSVIERALLIATNARIDVADLALHGRTASVSVAGDGLTLEAVERRHIAEVLERTHWHQGRAAEALGISPKTLYRKIREFGFVRPSAPR